MLRLVLGEVICSSQQDKGPCLHGAYISVKKDSKQVNKYVTWQVM